MGWPETLAYCFGMLVMAIILCDWPHLVIHKKCDCKKEG